MHWKISQINSLINTMSKLFKVGDYEITTTFKNDNVLSMVAEYLPTGQYFQSDVVELMRIKKDTIYATLERKSEKNLKVSLDQTIEDGVKYLLVKFTVSFDYLPEFSEDIRLQLCEKNENVIGYKTQGFKAEISKLNEALDRFETTPLIFHNQVTSITANSESWSRDIKKGQYLFRFSAQCLRTGSEGVFFELTIPGKAEPIAIPCSTYCMSSYPYPVSFSEMIEADSDGKIAFKAKMEGYQGGVNNLFGGGVGTMNLQNCHFILQPV